MRKTRMLPLSLAAAMALFAAAGHAFTQPPLEEELIHPSEVVFENGKPYSTIDGELKPVKSRTQGGEVVYYHLVRYDAEHGYVGEGGHQLADVAPSLSAGERSTPYRWDGSGRPDFYNSPYNRDARQRYFGPGYFGSCSRYDGCRGVQMLPFYSAPYYSR